MPEITEPIMAYVVLRKTRLHYGANTLPMPAADALAYALVNRDRSPRVYRARKVKHTDPRGMLKHNESFLTDDLIAEFRAVREDTERPDGFRSVSEFEQAMFPKDVERRQHEAESPSDAGRRCAEEAVRDTEQERETRGRADADQQARCPHGLSELERYGGKPLRCRLVQGHAGNHDFGDTGRDPEEASR